MEKGEYPRWDTWSNSYRSDCLMSLRPIRMVRMKAVQWSDAVPEPLLVLRTSPLTLFSVLINAGPHGAQDLPVRAVRFPGQQDGDPGG